MNLRYQIFVSILLPVLWEITATPISISRFINTRFGTNIFRQAVTPLPVGNATIPSAATTSQAPILSTPTPLPLNTSVASVTIGPTIATTSSVLPITTVPMPVGTSCTPSTYPSYRPIGICVEAANAGTSCAGLSIATSNDCTAAGYGYGNAVCCYGSSSTTTFATTSTPTSSPTTLSTGNVLNYANAMPANVVEQVCGIPNGDPSIFTSLQASLNTTTPVKRVKPKMVFKGRDSKHRFQVHPTIVGGFEVPNGAGTECWQISLLRFDLDGNVLWSCGGVIVGTHTVLTAAHCVVDTEAGETPAEFNNSAAVFIVTTGVIVFDDTNPEIYTQTVTNCSQNYQVAYAIPHPNYSISSNDNDLAILLLNRPIEFRPYGGCACKLCLKELIPHPGERCITSGWGYEVDVVMNPNVTVPRTAIPLKYVTQTILQPSYDNCSYFEGPDGQVTDLDLFLCAGGTVGESACVGDSGGPLFCYDPTTNTQYLAGLVSGGSSCSSGLGALYTKVGLYLDWIFNTALLGDLTVLI